MKTIFKNKYIRIGLVLLIGAAIGWIIKPSGQIVDSSHNHSIKESNHGASKNFVFTCSMHPQIRKNEPGDCPICGMDLIPLDNEQDEQLDPMAISMSPTAMQLANVSTAIIGTLDPVKSVRLNGKVQADERLVFSQSSHIPGRIEKLTVNFTGEFVRKGQTIAAIYSPDLVTAQEELFEAQKIKETQPQLFSAAREKLKNWKLSDRQVDEIIQRGIVKEEFAITADVSGYVTKKKVNLGDYVRKGEAVYEIADLSKVWVLFDIYESDMSWINKGDQVNFTVASLPGETFSGKVSFLDPVIDPKTRVAKARVEFSNKGQRLKPEMFASGTVETTLADRTDRIVVPKSAVMWTGKRSVVYVKNTTEKQVSFLMRNVTLGVALGESFIIEDGLQEGEEIAVNGTFSIDAAAQLAGKPSMMAKEGGASMSGHDHGGSGVQASSAHSTPEKTELTVNTVDQTFEADAAFQKQLITVFHDYLEVKDAMVASNANLTREKASTLLSSINRVDMSLVKGKAHMTWMKDLAVLTKSTEKISSTGDIEHMRKMLSPLSDQLYHTLKKYQVPVEAFRQFCPMALNNQGAYWLSDSEEILNPYFGEAMLTCGNVDDKL